MGDDVRTTRLIASIYDAAIDPSRWPEVLASITVFLKGRGAALLANDTLREHVEAHWDAGGDPRFMRLYAETYARRGPVAHAPVGEIEEIASIPELVPYDEFRRGRFYREWAEPQGFVDAAIAVIDKSATRSVSLAVWRDGSAGMVDDTMRDRMALVVPHVRRAVLIGKAIEFKQAEAATLADVLDGLSTSVFLVDSASRVVHANAAGEAILRHGEFLRSVGGRLAAIDPQIDHDLRETLAAVGRGDLASGRRVIAMPISKRDGERYVAHILPLASGERNRAGRPVATAALFVRKAELERPLPPEVIGRSYSLTQAELRVLLGIVDIGGVPEIATAFGIAETTVKTHLGRVFEKTGTDRQADLVKLVAGFSMPLAGAARDAVTGPEREPCGASLHRRAAVQPVPGNLRHPADVAASV
ncbi:MAG TPA: LuxR C-terminal-related transcriptional regulator [Xanthobacteraceae bacterium]|nr:LuxR C-terminal-related transcriptional regulator [Xanthobacteraceae bacterium]